MQTALLVINIVLAVSILIASATLLGVAFYTTFKIKEPIRKLQECSEALAKVQAISARYTDEIGKALESLAAVRSIEEGLLKAAAVQVKSVEGLKKCIEAFQAVIVAGPRRPRAESSPYTTDAVEAELEHGTRERDAVAELDAIMQQNLANRIETT